MTTEDVIKSFENAWIALCRRYKENPNEEMRIALNFLGRMITEVEAQVKKNGEVKQITIEEWLRWAGAQPIKQ